MAVSISASHSTSCLYYSSGRSTETRSLLNLKQLLLFFPPLPFFLLKSFIPIWPINFSTVKPCIVIYVKFPYNFHLESACFFVVVFSMSVGRNLSRHKSLTLKLTSPMMLGHKLCPPFPPGPPPCPLSLFILSNLPSGTIIMSMLVCVCILWSWGGF